MKRLLTGGAILRVPRVALLVFLTGLFIVSCGRHDDWREGHDSTIVVAYPYEAEGDLLGPSDDEAMFMVFLPLLRYDEQGNLEGRLALSWEHSDDFREWTYHLRTDVRWHDGVPVTAHDVAYTLGLVTLPTSLEMPGDAIESVTVHEYGHQYFQSLLASNEFEEAWLDEGVTSYAEISCVTAMVADGLVPEIAAYDYWGMERVAFALPKLPVTVGRMAWEYRHWRAYAMASYTKMALAMRTLEGLIGPETMARGLRDYVERFRFRHPTGRDLVEVLSEAAGRDLGPFFDQAVWGDAVADWSVLSVHQRRPPPADGVGWDGEHWRAVGEEQPTDGDERWLVDLELGRLGDFIGLVEVELRWSDGAAERRTWNSETRCSPT